MKMEQTECSETSVYKVQTPGNYPKESIQHSDGHLQKQHKIQIIIIIIIIIIISNRPDLTFTNKKTMTTYLMDIAVPNTHNLAKTITDKQNKYQELAKEIRYIC